MQRSPPRRGTKFGSNYLKLGSQLANIKEVFRRADTDAKGYLTRKDFKIALVGLLAYVPSKFEIDQMLSSISRSETGNGYVSLEDMKKVVHHHASFIPEMVIEQAFASADLDGDGRLSYREFSSMVARAEAIWRTEDSVSHTGVT
ncbi:hypothetical protein SmJEL517_g03885 [Synchytrium microbalum]|uniref:EF-hand domain-containing protein n=1 Tax=Synchytrium microbalum TaxID=1806994 RepID=A0A507C1L5_9FUNG|nr:uncharacterized protein SmJEL517_g03885 [Synchytrium microbalum]TPX33258.1 hypothetical protein SmJEL517_g03885 [Synchytrium microbalum]